MTLLITDLDLSRNLSAQNGSGEREEDGERAREAWGRERECRKGIERESAREGRLGKRERERDRAYFLVAYSHLTVCRCRQMCPKTARRMRLSVTV